MHRREFHAMGSRIVAVVDAEEAPPELEALASRFEDWEQSLSRFRNDSELCELNRRAGLPVAVSGVLWDVFDAARKADRYTGGLVNALIMDALLRAGYDRSFDQMDLEAARPDIAADASPVPSLESIITDAETRTICLPEGAQLDLGGIAKGWAAHHAMLQLSPYGPALVGAGGDIAVSGPRSDGEPWEIAVDDPFRQGEYIESLFIERGGIATSGRDYRRWRRAGTAQHHIIDPRTAGPADTDVLTATVIAPDAMLAEAYAKAMVIMGSEAALAWLDLDDSLAGLLVLEDGRRLDSRNLDRYL
jgi:thiamine biosynthesis lipoprotein